MNIEGQYLDHMTALLEHGDLKPNRTGTDTVSIFGHQMRHDLSTGFPLLTTKKVFTKGIIHELLWFLAGSTNTKYLVDNGVHIWDGWADSEGELGPIYGAQWRSWLAYDPHTETEDGEFLDQIDWVINRLKTNPECRRLIVSAWNVGELEDMALMPCHVLFQFNTRTHGGNTYLDCQLYQRSADWFLGVPFNIASYAMLTHMIAQVVGMRPGVFVHTFGDSHLYVNHFDQAREQILRPRRTLPKLVLNPDIKHIDDFKYEDFTIVNYDPHPAIKGAVAI